MAKMEGQRIVLMTALILGLFALVNLIISFITPYWVISWPRVYSPFRKIGLWEVCFAGDIIDRDPKQKSYHGCWWILAPEVQAIRSWIMPPWFIVVQILITISVIIEFVALALDIVVWSVTSNRDKTGLGRRRAPFNLVQVMYYINMSATIIKSCSVIMFGLAFKFDYFWLPNPHINYMSASYGLAIVSAFVSFFSTLAHRKYRNIVHEEYYQPANVNALPPPPAVGLVYKM